MSLESADRSAPTRPPLAARAMWLLALIIAVGTLSLAVAALPGRAKPLFLLPLAFGAASAGLAIVLRRSLSLRCSITVWLLTTALALGGYGQVVASAFQKFQSAQAPDPEKEQAALIAINMLKGTENEGLAGEMQRELETRRHAWDRYLGHRYGALGALSPRSATAALAVESLLVIAGVAIGRRILDSKPSACQALTPEGRLRLPID